MTQIPVKSHLSRAAVVLTVLIGWASFTSADNSGYHLTGVIGSNGAKAFAVVEQPDGQQRLLSEGGAIGNGYVGSISVPDKTVTLIFPDGEQLLSMTGSAMPNDEKKEFSLADYSDEVVQHQVGPSSLEDLQVLAQNAEKMTDKEVAVQLNKLLGLPAQTQIAAFNHEGIESPRTLLQQLAAQLPERAKQGINLGSIAVSDEEGRKRIYLQTNSTE